MANPTVMVIQYLGKKSIQTNIDKSDVLRHIIKNVSKPETSPTVFIINRERENKIVRLIESRVPVTQQG